MRIDDSAPRPTDVVVDAEEARSLLPEPVGVVAGRLVVLDPVEVVRFEGPAPA